MLCFSLPNSFAFSLPFSFDKKHSTTIINSFHVIYYNSHATIPHSVLQRVSQSLQMSMNCGYMVHEYQAIKRRYIKVQSGRIAHALSRKGGRLLHFAALTEHHQADMAILKTYVLPNRLVVTGQGIAIKMLHFAVESANFFGVARVYVHVDRNNGPAKRLYQNIGFEMVEMANSLLLDEQKYLLHLQYRRKA